jgi:tripartite-type tricarboxylate transporter receptor subunit TctC
VNGGQLRALAVTGSERSAELPDVPSMKEAGFPDVNTALWSGVFVPAATPAPIVKKLEAMLRKAVADPEVSAKLKAMAVTPGGRSSEDFRRMIDADIKTTADVVSAAKLEFKD